MMYCQEVATDLESGQQTAHKNDDPETSRRTVDEELVLSELQGDPSFINEAIPNISFFNSVSGQRLTSRRIFPKDRKRIQELHEEWFPVTYQQEFYDNLVWGKMCNTNDPLHTNVICNDKDDIIACLVGMEVSGSRLNRASRQLLLPDWPHRHRKAFYIMTLGTVTEARNMGLASSLVAEYINNVVQNDTQCGALYLHVITSNQSAIRFYERLNFWRVQEIESK